MPPLHGPLKFKGTHLHAFFSLFFLLFSFQQVEEIEVEMVDFIFNLEIKFHG